jgi:hypothetical protein
MPVSVMIMASFTDLALRILVCSLLLFLYKIANKIL